MRGDKDPCPHACIGQEAHQIEFAEKGATQAHLHDVFCAQLRLSKLPLQD